MFGIKTRIQKTARRRGRITAQKTRLRSRGMNFLETYLALFGARLHFRDEVSAYGLNNPITPLLNPVARLTKTFLAPFNPNNLGNWQSTPPFNLPTMGEASAVEIYKNLLKTPKNITGFFTSGATEGNIFCAWAGKESLKKQGIPVEKMTLICTDLTHYSVHKAARITELSKTVTPISLESWAMDPHGLTRTLDAYYKKGTRGFLIALTQGHTVGGTDDPIAAIQTTLEEFQKKHPKARFFVWIDAAYSGIIKPFLEKNWQPFSHSYVQAVAADFHKMLSVSYPAGIILHERSLTPLVETAPSYIAHKDQTVLGSRSGIPPLETLFTFQVYGSRRLQKIFAQALARKKTVLSELSQETSGKIVTHPASLQAALISTRPLRPSLLKKFALKAHKQAVLTTSGAQTIHYCKMYFFPRF